MGNTNVHIAVGPSSRKDLHCTCFRDVSIIECIRVYYDHLKNGKPITVAARSKACTVFARSNTGIVGSNPTRGTNVCVLLYCVCVVLCVGSGLAKG
jgi:hypothetical protein